MKNMLGVPLVLLMVASAGLNEEAPEAPVVTGSLAAGDSATVIYYSSGCFHWERYEISLQHSSPTVAVIYELSPDPEESFREYLGEIDLSTLDRIMLDKTIEFYRRERNGGCTTRDRVEIFWDRPALGTPDEVFDDDTCSVDRNFGMLSFQEIVTAVKMNALNE